MGVTPGSAGAAVVTVRLERDGDRVVARVTMKHDLLSPAPAAISYHHDLDDVCKVVCDFVHAVGGDR